MFPPLPKQRVRSQAALTLLELLIAIGIVGVLVTLIITATQKVRETSQSALCMNNMRQIGAAANLYLNEHRQIIPMQPNTSSTGWQHALAPYLGLTASDDSKDARVLRCPAQAGANGVQPRSYRWHLSRNKAGSSMATGSTTLLQILEQKRHRVALFKNPARHAMIFDIIYTGPAKFELWKNNNNSWGNVNDLEQFPYDNPDTYPRPHYQNRAVNILYYDGHIAPATYPLPDETYYWESEP